MYSPNEIGNGMKINVVFVEASAALECNRGCGLWQRLAERGVLAGERLFTAMTADGNGGTGYHLVIPATDGYERMTAIAAALGPDLKKMEVTFAGYANEWYGDLWNEGPASMSNDRFTARRWSFRTEGVYSTPENPERVLPF
jgi:hypothetical protein